MYLSGYEILRVFVFCAMTCNCTPVRSHTSHFWPPSPNLIRVSTKQSWARADLPAGYPAHMCHGLFLFQQRRAITSPRHNGGYFKMFLVIEAPCTAVMTHGSAFSDDNSATVSFIPSLVLGLIHLNEKAQMEHNGQDLSQSSWHRGGGKWRKRCITQCFSGRLAGALGKWWR